MERVAMPNSRRANSLSLFFQPGVVSGALLIVEHGVHLVFHLLEVITNHFEEHFTAQAIERGQMVLGDLLDLRRLLLAE